jgi:hypothetical protein
LIKDSASDAGESDSVVLDDSTDEEDGVSSSTADDNQRKNKKQKQHDSSSLLLPRDKRNEIATAVEEMCSKLSNTVYDSSVHKSIVEAIQLLQSLMVLYKSDTSFKVEDNYSLLKCLIEMNVLQSTNTSVKMDGTAFKNDAVISHRLVHTTLEALLKLVPAIGSLHASMQGNLTTIESVQEIAEKLINNTGVAVEGTDAQKEKLDTQTPN